MTWERGDLGGEPTVVVRCGGARLAVLERGATVLSWGVTGAAGRIVDLADGYRSAQELDARDLASFAVLAPFSDRIQGARYTFGGVEHDLQPGVPEGEREAMHGLVRDILWQAVGVPRDDDSDCDGGARIVFAASIGADDNPGYPFSVELKVTYVLEPRSLEIEIEAVNVGETAAPVSLGWHPYFQLPGDDGVDELELKVPARARVVTDKAQIPLDGPAAFQRVDGPATWNPIGKAELDDVLLVPVDAEEVCTELRSRRTGASIEVFQHPQEAGIMHVSTGDALRVRQREALAMKVLAHMPDAFNRAECADSLPLEPGARRRLRARVVFHPGG